MKVSDVVFISILAAAALPALPACHALAGAPPPLQAVPAAETFSVTATIRFIEIEGGFFGIFADDGRRFDPVNLPKDFAVDGLRVRVTGKTVPDAISAHMWGTIVKIESAEKIE